ncbi:MAG: hypothetical protein N5P05_002776 [Chroococcopsis gigantea SAG 12.99]|jgi:uncharacterized protein YecT (DUF1311 family)|nr:hypothetical protein [Chroococcopsis gigantea SAG 12.99]
MAVSVFYNHISDGTKQLVAAQLQWLKFRDAEIKYSFGFYQG